MTEFALCSFNIGGNAWNDAMQEKFEVHAASLAAANSMICLQECGAACLPRVKPELESKGFTLHGLAEGQATFVKESELKVLAVTTERVWKNTKSKYTDWRVVHCVVVETKDGVKIVVGNNHTHDGKGLHKIQGKKRAGKEFHKSHLRQACAAVQAVAESRGAYPIVVGDHNIDEAKIRDKDHPVPPGWAVMGSHMNNRDWALFPEDESVTVSKSSRRFLAHDKQHVAMELQFFWGSRPETSSSSSSKAGAAPPSVPPMPSRSPPRAQEAGAQQPLAETKWPAPPFRVTVPAMPQQGFAPPSRVHGCTSKAGAAPPSDAPGAAPPSDAPSRELTAEDVFSHVQQSSEAQATAKAEELEDKFKSKQDKKAARSRASHEVDLEEDHFTTSEVLESSDQDRPVELSGKVSELMALAESQGVSLK